MEQLCKWCSTEWKQTTVWMQQNMENNLLLNLICFVSFSCSWWGRGATWRRSCGWRLSGRRGSTWAAWRRSGSCCWCDRSSTQTTVRRTSTSQESQFRPSLPPFTLACGCSFSTLISPPPQCESLGVGEGWNFALYYWRTEPVWLDKRASRIGGVCWSDRR